MLPDRRLVIGSASTELRRRLGPTGWAVFEELVLCSVGSSDVCTASVSVRSLAALLGMSKDTVARALTRLRVSGLVSAHQSRGSTGTFATGSYQLHLPACVALDDVSDTTAITAPSPRRARTAPSTTQLALAIEP